MKKTEFKGFIIYPDRSIPCIFTVVNIDFGFKHMTIDTSDGLCYDVILTPNEFHMLVLNNRLSVTLPIGRVGLFLPLE